MADFVSRSAGDSSTMRGRTGHESSSNTGSSGSPPPLLPPQLNIGGDNGKEPKDQQQLAAQEKNSRTLIIGCVVIIILLLLVSAGATTSTSATTSQKEKDQQEQQQQQQEKDRQLALEREERFRDIKNAAFHRKLANQVPYMSADQRRKFVEYTQRKRRSQQNSRNRLPPHLGGGAKPDGLEEKREAAVAVPGDDSHGHHAQDQHNIHHPASGRQRGVGVRGQVAVTVAAADAETEEKRHDHEAAAGGGGREEAKPHDEPGQTTTVTKKEDDPDVETTTTAAAAVVKAEEQPPTEKATDSPPIATTTAAPVATVAETTKKEEETAAPASTPLTSCVDWHFSCGTRGFVVISPVPKSPAHHGAPVCSYRSAANRSLDAGSYGGGGGSHCFVPKLNKAPSASKANSDEPIPMEQVAQCFSAKQTKFPLLGQAQVISVPQHGTGTSGGQKLACYNGPNDMVCKLYAASFRWEPIVADWLSYAAVMLRRFRHIQYLNFVRRLKAKMMMTTTRSNSSSSSSSLSPQLEKFTVPNVGSGAQHFIDEFRPVLTSEVDPSSLADDNYGVEFLDVGMHVGTMANHMWRMGFPVKGFEPMPTNINLLLATRCLNSLNTEFPSVEQCKAEFFHHTDAEQQKKDKKQPLLGECLAQPADLSSRSAVAKSRCPVAETVPFQLSYVAAGAKSGERCAMFSDAGNIGDVLVSCDRNLTAAAQSNDKIFIRDSWYTVRGTVTTQKLDDYIFREQEAMCTTADDAGGVRFQHQAFRRHKELRNVATRAVLAKLEQTELKQKDAVEQVFAATDAVAKARLEESVWRMRNVDQSLSSLAGAARDVLLGDASLLPRMAEAPASSTSNNSSSGGAIKLAAPLADKKKKKSGDDNNNSNNEDEEIERLIRELAPGEGFLSKDYIVKIDVEGHEANVINGAERWMSDPLLRPKILIIENWSHLNVTAFCMTMVKYGYVGLSTRTQQWVHNDAEAARHHQALHVRSEPHDDLAWMPLKWAQVLSFPEYHSRLEETIGRKLEMPDAI